MQFTFSRLSLFFFLSLSLFVQDVARVSSVQKCKYIAPPVFSKCFLQLQPLIESFPVCGSLKLRFQSTSGIRMRIRCHSQVGRNAVPAVAKIKGSRLAPSQLNIHGFMMFQLMYHPLCYSDLVALPTHLALDDGGNSLHLKNRG